MQEIGGPVGAETQEVGEVRAASSRLQEQGAHHAAQSRDQLASWEIWLIDFPNRLWLSSQRTTERLVGGGPTAAVMVVKGSPSHALSHA